MRCHIVLVLLVVLHNYSAEGALEDIGAECTAETDTCPENAQCTGDTTVCTCDDGYTGSDDATACIADGQLGGGCKDGDTKCDVANSECSNAKCACSDTFSEYNGACVADGQLGGGCKDGDTKCDVANSECSNAKCACSDTFSEYNGACVEAGQLGGVCKASNVCDAANTECDTGGTTTCKCKAGYKESGGKCSGAAGVVASLALLLLSLVASRFL